MIREANTNDYIYIQKICQYDLSYNFIVLLVMIMKKSKLDL